MTCCRSPDVSWWSDSIVATGGLRVTVAFTPSILFNVFFYMRAAMVAHHAFDFKFVFHEVIVFTFSSFVK